MPKQSLAHPTNLRFGPLEEPEGKFVRTGSAHFAADRAAVALQLAEAAEHAAVVIDMDRQAATAHDVCWFLDILGRGIVEEIPDNQFGLPAGTALEVANTAGEVRRPEPDLVTATSGDGEQGRARCDLQVLVVDRFVVVFELDARRRRHDQRA